MRLLPSLRKLRHDEGGATATEYALLIGCVAFICLFAWDGIGASLRRIFEYINTYLV
jgi:Flp pilus assembly pilin Flp